MPNCECDSLYCTTCYPLFTPEETRAYYLGCRHLYAEQYLQRLSQAQYLQSDSQKQRQITKLIAKLKHEKEHSLCQE